MGVTCWGGDAPEKFGVFDRAVLSLFMMSWGNEWPKEAVPLQTEDGFINYPAAIYLSSYVILVNWTLLQVPRCFLVD